MDYGLPDLVNLFIKNRKVEKEKLYHFVSKRFFDIQHRNYKYFSMDKNVNFFKSLKDQAVINNDKMLKHTVVNILKLPITLDDWISESTSSQERFEFFIISKAAELSSGDQKKDYYNALLIRHDQLLSAVYVFMYAIMNLESFRHDQYVKDSKNNKLHFFQTSIDKHIFFNAEKMYEIRKNKGLI